MKATYKSYPSNLTPEQWVIIAPYLPKAQRGGRPRHINLRAILDAIFYVLCSGCAWRMLPGDLPPWQTVYWYFRKWRLDGTWERIHRYLRQWVRRRRKRHSTPSVGIIDSQSVKTGGAINQAVGYDGGKQVKGRKRHLLVDTLGLVVMVVVTAANVSDPAGAKTLFARVQRQRRWLKRLFLIYTDGTYRGEAFVHWVFDTYRWILEAVTRQEQRKGFQVLPKRWIVERTFAWFSNCRRLSKDYERLPQTSETFIYLAMTQLMLKRLA
jgi:putative transposase